MKTLLTLRLKKFILALIAILLVGYGVQLAIAQTEDSEVSFVALIGITSVPEPLALPNGPGKVTYYYAVKNFLQEIPLIDVRVVVDKCIHIRFVEGDDNNDKKLDYNETWRYECPTTLNETTNSVATATGTAHSIVGTHQARATVVVGSSNPAPLVSIVNITKVSYPLSLPNEGGEITFTYRVSNPGIVPLSEVNVSDNKCSNMSGKLGDTNNNGLLDLTEVWIYTCKMTLLETTTNTATVTAVANGLQALGEATTTIVVNTTPDLPNVGNTGEIPSANTSPTIRIVIWGILSAILAALIIFFAVTRKK